MQSMTFRAGISIRRPRRTCRGAFARGGRAWRLHVPGGEARRLRPHRLLRDLLGRGEAAPGGVAVPSTAREELRGDSVPPRGADGAEIRLQEADGEREAVIFSRDAK